MSPVLLQNIVWEIVLSFCWGDQVTCDVTRKKKQHDQNWPFRHLYKDTGPKRRFILHDCTLFAAHQTVESHKRRVSSFCSKVPTQSTREAVDTTQKQTQAPNVSRRLLRLPWISMREVPKEQKKHIKLHYWLQENYILSNNPVFQCSFFMFVSLSTGKQDSAPS